MNLSVFSMQTMRLSYSNIFYQICGEMSFIQCVF